MPGIEEKIKSIRLLLLDVDGILTSGVIFYGEDNISLKGFYIQDGLGIKLLQKSSVSVGIISAKISKAVSKRAEELQIEYVYLGQEEKITAYETIKTKLKLNDHEIAYMGDDLPDLPVLKRVGLAITVPQASEIIKQHVDIITKNKGGQGAVREICELIMNTQGHFNSVIQSYLK